MKGKKFILSVIPVIALAAGIAYSADVKKGQELFNDTALGTSGKSCNSCHADGKDIDGSKETYSILGSKQTSIEEAVNFCIKMAMSGKPLELDSEKMKDMVSYLKTLKGKKKGMSEAPGY